MYVKSAGDAYENSWLDLEGDDNRIVGSGSRDRPGGWQLAAQDVVNSRRIIEEIHFDPDHPNMQIFQRSFEGQSSSTLLSLSPPHSSLSWGPNARNHTEYGEPPVQDDNNGAHNAYLSGLVGLAGGFKLLETDIKTTKPFIVPVDYIPLRRLEAKMEFAEEGGLETGHNLGPSLQVFKLHHTITLIIVHLEVHIFLGSYSQNQNWFRALVLASQNTCFLNTWIIQLPGFIIETTFVFVLLTTKGSTLVCGHSVVSNQAYWITDVVSGIL